MKKNKIINLISIILMIFITLLILNTKAYASGTSGNFIDVIEVPSNYQPNSMEGESALSQKANTILGVINAIGIFTSVITLMVIGIKYMIGSIDEKAEYKKTMGIYLLGAFLLFATTTIPNILYKIATKI